VSGAYNDPFAGNPATIQYHHIFIFQMNIEQKMSIIMLIYYVPILEDDFKKRQKSSYFSNAAMWLWML